MARRSRKYYSKKYKTSGTYSKSASAKANQALKLAKQANKTELKYRDTSVTSAQSITDTGVYFSTTNHNLSLGTGISDRIGNTVMAKSVHFRTTFTKHASATASQVRIIIYKNLNEGVSSTPTDYLETADIMSQKSINHRFDTKTLYDKTFILDTDNPKKIWNYKLKLNWPIHYSITGNTPDKGSFGILYISDEPTNYPTASAGSTSRFFFTDK